MSARSGRRPTRHLGVPEALKTTYEDNEHWTQHWVQVFAVAISSKENDAKIAKLKREAQELKRTMRQSRPPRMQPRQKALPAPPQLLALLAAPGGASSNASRRNKRGRGGRGAKGKGAGRVRTTSRVSTRQEAAAAMVLASLASGGSRMPATSSLHDSNKQYPICFNLQKGTCTDPKACMRMHCCNGCATGGRPHSECHCLPSRLN